MKTKIYLGIGVFLCLIVSLWIFTFFTKKDYRGFVAPGIYVENPTKKQYFVEGVPMIEKKDFPFEELQVYTDFDKENGEYFVIDFGFIENIQTGEYLELLLGKNHYHMQFQNIENQDGHLSFRLRSKYFNGHGSYFFDDESNIGYGEIKVFSTDGANKSFELKFDTLGNALFFDIDIEKPRPTNIIYPKYYD